MLEWMLSSSVLILAVLAARRLLGDRISGTVRYGLWLVVLVRLLVPVSLFSAPVSLEALLPRSPAVEEALGQTALYAFPDPEQSGTFDEPLPEDAPTGVMGVRTHGQRILGAWVEYHDGCMVQTREGWRSYRFYADWRDVLFLVYLAGAAGTALVMAVSNLGFARRLRRRREAVEAAVPFGDLPVYQARGLESPCLCGLVFPAIYVTPETAEDPDMLRHVLAHEGAHWAHRDHIWSFLRCVALALHWYNPLVWKAASASRQDGELSCDQLALAYLGEGERTAYGRTLLSLLTARPRPADLLRCATTMSGGGKQVKERLERILKAPRMLAVTAVCLLTAAVCLGLFLFAGESRWVENTSPEADFLYARTEQGENVVETLQFRVEDDDPGAAELKKINQAVRDFAQSFVPDSDGQWAEVYAYPCVGSTARTIVLKGNTFPTYGTDGTLLSWCWDVEDHRAVTLEEARAAAGWTDGQIQRALMDYVDAHSAELGVSGAGEIHADWDVVGFRQRMDGGWDFFLQYHRAATADSDAYEYLLTFSDGAILPGVAIPAEELAEVGCSLEGLSPYDTTGRVERTDALALLRSLEPADLLYLDETTDLTAEELAPALAAAAEKGWAQPQEHTPEEGDILDGCWTVTAYLEGGPDVWSSEDAHLTLSAGLPEGWVSVTCWDGFYSDGGYLEDANLYWLLRNAWDREGTVDQEALTAYWDSLSERMESRLQELQLDSSSPRPAGYDGYEVTEFYLLGAYEDVAPGVDADLYAFDYGITLTDPAGMLWVGGSYLDGRLRMRGYDSAWYFVAYRQGGQTVSTRFLAWDALAPAYLDSSMEKQEDTIRQRLLYFWEHPEAE